MSEKIPWIMALGNSLPSEYAEYFPDSTHDLSLEKAKNLEDLFKKHHLQIFDNKQFKREGKIISEWVTHGTPANHNQLVESLFADTDIKEFTY